MDNKGYVRLFSTESIDLMILMGPFQLWLFYDSMILLGYFMMIPIVTGYWIHSENSRFTTEKPSHATQCR